MILYNYTSIYIYNITIYIYNYIYTYIILSYTICRDLPMSGASKQRQLLHQVHLLHQAVGEFSGLDIGIAGGGDMTMGGVGGTGNLEHIYIYVYVVY